jgi:Kdo2-lipid IVA lauroyltransferase/acyltransferase
MSRVIYYLLLKPLSLLPLAILYVFADFVYFLLSRIIPYRKEVIINNITKSFPGKSAAEIKQIVKGFYRFLADLMVETIWNFSLSEKEARKRLIVENPEVLNKYYDAGKDVIIVVGHYNSWEFLLVAFNLMVNHRGAVIYTSLTDKFLDKIFIEFREKFGMKLLTKGEVKHAFQDGLDKPMAILFGSDQAPSIVARAHWTTFLHQDTAVAIGVEKYAIKYDLPVFFGGLKKIKRGHYSINLELLTEEPLKTNEGEISDMHVRALERLIQEKPQYWLWSHKRWKKERARS